MGTERRGRAPATRTVFTVHEVAFAAGVSVKVVNQAIDRKDIESRVLLRAPHRPGRGVGVGEAVYLHVRHVLAPEVRPKLYRLVRARDLPELPRRFEVGNVVVDLEPAIREVEARLGLLSRLHERVVTEPDVHGGEPVFQGTRTPVYTIARKLALGSTAEEIREDYPHLQEDDLEVARTYAALYPRRGRPRSGQHSGDVVA